MDTHKHKVRLSVDCSEEERMYIKMLAAKNLMTISEYLLSLARQDMPKSTQNPNEITKKALESSYEEEGKTFDSLDDFWTTMGINPHAKD